MFIANFELCPREPVEVEFELPERKPVEAVFEIRPTISSHNKLSGRDESNCHPIDSITGLRSALGTFIYEQGVSSNTWEIQHNLGKFPSVSVVDTAGNEIITSVKYIDENNIIIYMTSAFKGKAYLN